MYDWHCLAQQHVQPVQYLLGKFSQSDSCLMQISAQGNILCCTRQCDITYCIILSGPSPRLPRPLHRLHRFASARCFLVSTLMSNHPIFVSVTAQRCSDDTWLAAVLIFSNCPLIRLLTLQYMCSVVTEQNRQPYIALTILMTKSHKRTPPHKLVAFIRLRQASSCAVRRVWRN